MPERTATTRESSKVLRQHAFDMLLGLLPHDSIEDTSQLWSGLRPNWRMILPHAEWSVKWVPHVAENLTDMLSRVQTTVTNSIERIDP